MPYKKRKRFVHLAFASAVALGAYATPFSSSFIYAETENIKVQLLSVNDLHGQIDYSTTIDTTGDGQKDTKVGGIEYLAAYMEEKALENKNTLYVHSGDMIGGSPLIAAAFQDEPVVEIMNEMGFDVGTVGNHEFDEGIQEMLRMIDGGDHPTGKGTKGYQGMNFPLVAANAYDKSTDKLLLPPYHIQEVDGVKVGFIGVVTQSTPSMVIKQGNEHLKITDEVEAINTYTKELKSKGIKAIVVLAHNPASQQADGTVTDDAARFANEVDDEVDIIFAGHNHQGVNGTVNNKLIVQAYEYGTAFGEVDIEIDPSTGDIVDKKANIHRVINAGIEPHQEVKKILDKYNKLVEPVKAEVINENARDYPSLRYPQLGMIGDHPVGNLIADGMRQSMNADFALMNGGGVRAGLDAGPITFGELYTIQPFGNVLNKVEMTGKGLRQVLNNQITSYGLDFSISGFRYTYEYDDKLKRGKVADMYLPTGEKISDDKSYSVVINNFMYGSKYGIDKVSLRDPEVGPVDVDALADYVRTLKGPVDYKEEGRIQEVSNQFSDVPVNHWANPYVTHLAKEGIVKGKADNVYAPAHQLTRSQFASMLVRSLGLEEKGDTPFKDVTHLPENVKSEIGAAYEAGIIKGTTPHTFEPFKPISRAQMVTMLIRAYKVANDHNYEVKTKISFNDVQHLDSEMKESVQAAYEIGYIQGYGNQFKPQHSATRVQAAKIIALFLTKQ
ncbi:5'-nucleotidase C-terminal domain-containing protein [Bacillus sp. CGMCC 1.16541]|uniref:5'-nucleotidase C-terminal domain-containing protein n=1 Tax=Bacillus sp. CGMCC 1.16541 TaxID=2185143 RepID=UPI000D730332|nr:5'-nucleotidase C-terminal domain-containing protein [Bacillus sp. CGMCC 1.16541]